MRRVGDSDAMRYVMVLKKAKELCKDTIFFIHDCVCVPIKTYNCWWCGIVVGCSDLNSELLELPHFAISNLKWKRINVYLCVSMRNWTVDWIWIWVTDMSVKTCHSLGLNTIIIMGLRGKDGDHPSGGPAILTPGPSCACVEREVVHQ